MKSRLYTGKLKKWNDKRGFGFIQPTDGSPDVFIHISDFKDGTRRPQVKETIYYDTSFYPICRHDSGTTTHIDRLLLRISTQIGL